jgi:hypothetical protein
MKTYRQELTGAIKGNARLRRLLDAERRRVAVLESNVKALVIVLDGMGRGDTKMVRMAASSVGWRRDPEVARKCREAMK